MGCHPIKCAVSVAVTSSDKITLMFYILNTLDTKLLAGLRLAPPFPSTFTAEGVFLEEVLIRCSQSFRCLRQSGWWTRVKWGKVAQDQSDLVPSSNVNDLSNYFPPQFYDFLWFFEITWITSLHNLTDGNDGLDEVWEEFLIWILISIYPR